MIRRVKLGIITSPGGHLYKTYQLKDWWRRYDQFWVTDQKVAQKLSFLDGEKVYQGFFPENRNLTNFFKNLILSWRILRYERPDILFSMGAGIAPPFFIIGKLLSIRLIFMETFILIDRPTLSGKLVYPLTDLFLVQNKKMLKYYHKAKFFGSTL